MFVESSNAAPRAKGRPRAKRVYKRASLKEDTRVRPPVEGIQVNTCRNAACVNFGVEPLLKVKKGLPGKDDPPEARDLYRVTTSGSGRGLTLQCMKCGGRNALKSNLAIKEELDRISEYSCPA
jgi:hypothetical protein